MHSFEEQGMSRGLFFVASQGTLESDADLPLFFVWNNKTMATDHHQRQQLTASKVLGNFLEINKYNGLRRPSS
jgi:hypothetical protein